MGIAGIVAAFVMTAVLWGDRQEAFNGGLRADRFSLLLGGIFLAAALLTIMLAWREPAAVDRRGEFVCLILVSTTGMMLVAGAGDLISIFLGIEILSVALYVLCALEVWRERSLESGLKYLIIGAIGASILLYGLTLLFGATGSTDLSEIGDGARGLVVRRRAAGGRGDGADRRRPGLQGVGGAVPHVDARRLRGRADDRDGLHGDRDQGRRVRRVPADLRRAPCPTCSPTGRRRSPTLAVASIVVGNVAALVQTNMKRLLAYSSVAQAGYLLIGVAVGSIQGAEAVIYYLVAYTAMTMAAFAVVIIREREVEDGDQLAALTGYGRARPLIGVVMTLAMLSLAGFPPLAGFVGKFLLFGSAVEADLTWLAIVGAVGSMVSLGYYLRVVTVMWLPPLEGAPRKILRIPGPVVLATVTSGVAVVALALMASPVIDACRGAAEALLARGR